MLKADYTSQNCSIARALEIVGERWTLLVVRDVFLGYHRFDVIQKRLGVARNVLQARLERLVEAEILERTPYQERPVRYEYVLTEKGKDLWPTIVALLQWGDKYDAPNGPPRVLEHRECGGVVDGHRRCTKCGQDLEVDDVISRRGPGSVTVPAA